MNQTKKGKRKRRELFSLNIWLIQRQTIHFDVVCCSRTFFSFTLSINLEKMHPSKRKSNLKYAHPHPYFMEKIYWISMAAGNIQLFFPIRVSCFSHNNWINIFKKKNNKKAFRIKASVRSPCFVLLRVYWGKIHIGEMREKTAYKFY